MSVWRCKMFTLSGDHWDTSGDAEFSDGGMTVTSPAELLSGPKWSPGAPNYDEENDVYTLTADTVYLACDKDSGVPFEEDDATLVLTVARKGGVPANALEMHARYYAPPDDDADSMHVDLQKHFATAMKATINDEDAAVRAQDIKALDDWVLDTWYTVTIRAAGTTLSYDQDGRKRIACDYMARSHTGTFALQNTGDESDWWIGAGGESGHALPTLYRQRDGVFTMTTSWQRPSSLGEVRQLIHHFNESEDEDAEVAGQALWEYRLQSSGSWGDWTAVPVDGNLSGVGADWDEMQLRVTLTNSADHTKQPTISAVGITYLSTAGTVSSPTDVEIVQAIADEIEEDEELSALTGWAGTVQCFESAIDQIPLQGSVGVYVCPVNRPGNMAGVWTDTADFHVEQPAVDTLLVSVHPCMMKATSSPEALVASSAGLLWLTSKITALLSKNNLDGMVRWIDLEAVQYDTQTGRREGNPYEKRSTLLLSVVIGPVLR